MPPQSNLALTMRSHTLKGLYELIGKVSRAHVNVFDFVVGEYLSATLDNNSYPLIFLETISNITELDKAFRKRYDVALNFVDVKTDDATVDQLTAGYDKGTQVLDEIKQYFQQKSVFGAPNVSDMQCLLYEEDGFIRVRAEFQLTVEKPLTEPVDLAQIFPGI